MEALLLGLSIALSTSRNLLSKNLSVLRFGSRAFFVRQSILFLFGGLCIAVFGGASFRTLSPKIWLFAAIYGTLLILAQWFYTVALGGGNTALCSTVYSMGFILPTLSGAIFWSELFSVPDAVGVLCAAAAVFCSGYTPRRQSSGRSAAYFLPLVVAMLASGGLGIMQKLQQKSDVADERAEFLVLAFLLAGGISLAATLIAPRTEDNGGSPKTFWMAAGIGVAFGSCNLLNTALAGMLPGAVFFPTLNIGVILVTMLCGILFLGERLRIREILVLLLGGASILLLAFF